MIEEKGMRTGGMIGVEMEEQWNIRWLTDILQVKNLLYGPQILLISIQIYSIVLTCALVHYNCNDKFLNREI